MKKSVNTVLKVLAVIAALMLSAVSIQAETVDCTPITSLPTVISSQGVYCLTSHLSSNLASGNAIEITVNNVIIDLNGYKIGNLAAGNTTEAIGIYAYQRQNITILNGTIRGFYTGIWLKDDTPYTTAQGHSVYDIRADMNFLEGIQVQGRGNVIMNNIVVDTGGSANSDYAYGIRAYGPGALVKDNIIYETKEQSTGHARGIYIAHSDGTVVWNNSIGNADLGTGTSYGIRIGVSDDVLIRDNHISKMNYGIEFMSVAPGSSGKYMGNLTSGCDTAFSGGTDAGGNN